jgi:hypothetical protein
MSAYPYAGSSQPLQQSSSYRVSICSSCIYCHVLSLSLRSPTRLSPVLPIPPNILRLHAAEHGCREKASLPISVRFGKMSEREREGLTLVLQCQL